MSGWPLFIIWALCALAVYLFYLVLAARIRPLLIGLFIDSRCMVSLSRFQMALWIWLILSAWAACVLARVFAGSSDPLAVAIPEHLWWLMGISTASLVGSPVIKSIKMKIVPSRQFKAAGGGMGVVGVLRVNTMAEKSAETKGSVCPGAKWTDMFVGEEVGNCEIIDLGKVQMFLFTLVIALVYLVALLRLFWGQVPDELPAVGDSMVALLAISHAGYLTYKAAPHS